MGLGALRALGVVLLLAGAGILAMYFLAPQQTERVYGDLKTSVIQGVDDVRADVFDELPVVRLGATGGIPELDRCDGTFTEMASYEREGVPPVWAAHNNCGGDVALPWEIGQEIRIEGRDEVYEIVDIRETSKIWSSTSDLVGLGGDLALQTCYYGEDRMKFLGLAPVA
jgi:hypothetical protein